MLITFCAFLSTQVKKVFYPGLESHPQYEIAQRQMSGFSGMVSAELDADLEGCTRFLEALKVFTLAESLGCVESLVEHPYV